MKSLFLTIMDWDITWVGLNWLRPKPSEPITGAAALMICLVTSLAFFILAPVVYFALSTAHSPVPGYLTLLLCGAGALCNCCLQLLSAVYWNERATARCRESVLQS
jgi:hypothetical protein